MKYKRRYSYRRPRTRGVFLSQLFLGGLLAFVLLFVFQRLLDVSFVPFDEGVIRVSEEEAYPTLVQGEYGLAEEEEEAQKQRALAGEALDVDEDEPAGVHRRLVEEGDSAGRILQEWLSPPEVQALIRACSRVFSLSRLSPGNAYTLVLSGGRLERFEYEINDFDRLVAERSADGFSARLERLPCEVRLEKKRLVVTSSLFQTVAAAGEKASLAVLLSDIFGWEVNFIKELRENDTFDILLEKRYLNGEFKGYGKVLAVYFVNQGKRYEAFRHDDAVGTHFFAANGDSLKRAFLKAPLSFSRISSGYTMRRLHPISKVVRPHPGIDYAAPTGTPVRAIGAGTVMYAGWGGAAGRYIKVAHSRGYESTYMHLSGFAKGLKKGMTVRQGQIIGYVGMSGSATGPHLDFRMKKNGQFLNPMKVVSPRADGVPAGRLGEFKRRVALYRSYLSGERPLEGYTPSNS